MYPVLLQQQLAWETAVRLQQARESSRLVLGFVGGGGNGGSSSGGGGGDNDHGVDGK
jgi:hypothetical protein